MHDAREAFELLYKLVERRFLSFNVLVDFLMAAHMENYIDECEFSEFTAKTKALIIKLKKC